MSEHALTPHQQLAELRAQLDRLERRIREDRLAEHDRREAPAPPTAAVSIRDLVAKTIELFDHDDPPGFLTPRDQIENHVGGLGDFEEMLLQYGVAYGAAFALACTQAPDRPFHERADVAVPAATAAYTAWNGFLPSRERADEEAVA